MTATLVGSTGFIGGFLLEELLKDNYFDKVRILLRRPVSFTHPRLEKKLVDFDDPESLQLAIDHSDIVFCSVGTTQKKVKGNKEAYRKVDVDIPVNIARFSMMTGCETFLLVSSIGANSQSNNFYLRLKGEVEDKVSSMALTTDLSGNRLKSVHIFQPSLLLGKRAEFRPGEKISKLLASAFRLFIPSNYKPVHGKTVARAMINAARNPKPGLFHYRYQDICELSGD